MDMFLIFFEVFAFPGSHIQHCFSYVQVDIISRMNHTNIVRLLGYCDERNEQILVYEFMPNGTLKGILAQSKSILTNMVLI